MYTKSISFIVMFVTLLVVAVGFGSIYAYAQLTSGPSPQQQQEQQQSSSPYVQQQQNNGLGVIVGQGNGITEGFQPGNPDPTVGVGPTITPGGETPPLPYRPEHSAPGFGSGGIYEPFPRGAFSGEKEGWVGPEEGCESPDTGGMCPPGQANN